MCEKYSNLKTSLHLIIIAKWLFMDISCTPYTFQLHWIFYTLLLLFQLLGLDLSQLWLYDDLGSQTSLLQCRPNGFTHLLCSGTDEPATRTESPSQLTYALRGFWRYSLALPGQVRRIRSFCRYGQVSSGQDPGYLVCLWPSVLLYSPLTRSHPSDWQFPTSFFELRCRCQPHHQT